ncbi:MAG: hypothetical protein QXR82_00070 [Candidatus Bathyarchaeia archaeon]
MAFKKEKLPLLFVISVLVASMVLIATVAKELTELFFYAELISISTIYMLLSIIIPTLYPKKIKPESIFFGGAAKPPYIYPEEVYSPPLPLLEEKVEKEETF